MRFFVGVMARPIRILSRVQQPENVAHGIVIVLLAIAVQRVPVGGKRVIHSGNVVIGGLRPAGLADVLAALGPDQAIDRVIDVLVAWGNDLVLEINSLLRVVANGTDVADGSKV